MTTATSSAGSTAGARSPTPVDAPAPAPPVLSARQVSKTYRLGRVDVPVLRGVNLDIPAQQCVAILGASGSGKSTLLHLLGGLDRVDRARSGALQGSILFQGRDLRTMRAGELDAYRRRSVGFVFQFYHLLPELNVVENVALAAMVRGGFLGYWRRKAELRARAEQLLGQMGLSHRLKHRPVELSGGERQRVAIARALMNDPVVLLADEPTGNLDHASGQKILDLLFALRRESNLTVVLVTHDQAVARRADRVVQLIDGQVAAPPTQPSPPAPVPPP